MKSVLTFPKLSGAVLLVDTILMRMNAFVDFGSSWQAQLAGPSPCSGPLQGSKQMKLHWKTILCQSMSTIPGISLFSIPLSTRPDDLGLHTIRSMHPRLAASLVAWIASWGVKANFFVVEIWGSLEFDIDHAESLVLESLVNLECCGIDDRHLSWHALPGPRQSQRAPRMQCCPHLLQRDGQRSVIQMEWSQHRFSKHFQRSIPKKVAF